MLSVFDLLVMHPLAADLPAGWVHRLARHARPVFHVTGFRLFREDAPADRLWLLPPYRYRFGATVADDIRAVEIDAAHVRSLIAEDAELGREVQSRLLAVMAGRLLAARNRLAELYAYPGDLAH